jgi:hypothetical protein
MGRSGRRRLQRWRWVWQRQEPCARVQAWFFSERYLPYALGGGYVLSSPLVRYLADNGDRFLQFHSEVSQEEEGVHNEEDKGAASTWLPLRWRGAGCLGGTVAGTVEPHAVARCPLRHGMEGSSRLCSPPCRLHEPALPLFPFFSGWMGRRGTLTVALASVRVAGAATLFW